MRPFVTEGGAVLPEAHVNYATFGTLSPKADNAVLLPSHFMADASGYSWLIGPGKALDPSRYFLIATELFGNGGSSSPSNTAEPFHGPRFPPMTIKDNVEASYRLLTEGLQIERLLAVVGFSMGGQQAFQWAVSHPEFVDRIVVTAATAKTHPHGVVRLEGQIAAITADPSFADGDYVDQPRAGLAAFGVVWASWLYSQAWWRQERWKETPETTLQNVIDQFRTDFIPGADANDLILQMRSWQKHDVGSSESFGGDLTRALATIRAKVLYMPAATDLYFPIDDAEYEAGFIPDVEFTPIPSIWGHTAGAASNAEDERFLNHHIRRFLEADQP